MISLVNIGYFSHHILAAFIDVHKLPTITIIYPMKHWYHHTKHNEANVAISIYANYIHFNVYYSAWNFNLKSISNKHAAPLVT